MVAESLYNLTKKLRHEMTKLHSVHEHMFIAEGTVTYTIESTGKVLDPIPLVSVFETSDCSDGVRRIQSFKSYIDITPLIVATGLWRPPTPPTP